MTIAAIALKRFQLKHGSHPAQLSELVPEFLTSVPLDPVDGHLYLFLNKRRHLAKVLWFDGSGWCVLAKRLEAGSFQLPPVDGDKAQVAIEGSAFASLLAGLDFTAARPGWYRRISREKC